MRYLRRDGTKPLTLSPAKGPTSHVVSFLRTADAVTVGAGDVHQIALQFRLPATMDASRLDGVLIVSASAMRTKTSAAAKSKTGAGLRAKPSSSTRAASPASASEDNDPLVIDVRGRVAAPRGISIKPPVVVLQTTKWLPDAVAGSSAEVQLRGPEASALLMEPENIDGETLLRNGAGNSARLVWNVTGDKEDRHLVVEALGSPAAGGYTGPLSLVAGSAAPKVTVTVKSRHAFIWPLIVIGLGSIVGGLIPLLGSLARRRDLLRAELTGVLQEYQARRGDRSKPTAAYNLDNVLGPEPEPWTSTAWMASPRQRGAAGLFSSIRWARSDADLDEDTVWAHELVSRIQRWIAVEETSSRLRETLGHVPVAINGHEWRSRKVVRDTQLLLQHATEEPKSDTAADALVSRLARQQYWHQGVAGAWRELAELPNLPADARPTLVQRLIDLADAKPEAERTLDERITLQVDLDNLRSDLAGHATAATADETVAERMAPARVGAVDRLSAD